MVMKYDPGLHHRHSLRLKGFDYSQAGAYFVTICARERECLFGVVEKGAMVLNASGRAVQATWYDLLNHVPDIALGDFVIMPNHVHGIVTIMPAGAGLEPGGETRAGLEPGGETRAGLEPAPTKAIGLPEIVRQFKTFSARRINAIRQSPGVPVWQRNYYEHVIRNDDDFCRIVDYIAANPGQWTEDSLNPDATVGAGSKPARL